MTIALIGVLIGLIAGWYARDMRDMVRVIYKAVEASRKKTQRKDEYGDAGVITGKSAYQRGQVVRVPDYTGDDTGSVVRAPTPDQVKKDQAAEFNKELGELDPYKHTKRIF